MIVVSLIQRKKGTTVQMDDQVYRFNPENNHSYNVTEQSHIERFLQISDGFLVLGDPVDDPSIVQTDTTGNPVLAVMPEQEPKSEPEPEPEQTQDDREQLASLYVDKFGKRPHHKLSVDKIKQALEA